MRVFIPSLAHSLTHSLLFRVLGVIQDKLRTQKQTVPSRTHRVVRLQVRGMLGSLGGGNRKTNSQRREGQRGHVSKPGSTDWTAYHPCPAGHRGRCWGGWHGDRAGRSCEGVKAREGKVWMKNEDCVEGSRRHLTDDMGPQKQGPERQNREDGHHSLSNRATEGF